MLCYVMYFSENFSSLMYLLKDFFKINKRNFDFVLICKRGVRGEFCKSRHHKEFLNFMDVDV